MKAALELARGSKKAILACVIAVVGAAIPAAEGGFTSAEILTVVLAGAVALGGVWGVENTGSKAPSPKP